MGNVTSHLAIAELYGLAAGVTSIVAYLPYIRAIRQGNTRPERTAWIIWSAVYVTQFAAQAAKGATNSLWLVGMQLVCVLGICMLAFRYGSGDFDRRSAIWLACAGAALVLWFFAKSASVAIIIASSVELSAAVLTSIKTYKQPGSESLVSWIIACGAGILGIPAVGHAAPLILYLYPASLMLMSAGIVGASLLGARVAVPVPCERQMT